MGDTLFKKLDISSDVLEIVLNVLEQYASYDPKLVDHDNYPKNKVLSDISNAEIKAAMNIIDS